MKHPYVKDSLHYGWLLWFLVTHSVGGVGIIYAIVYAPRATIILAFAIFFLCHLSIACGAHRLYSHVAYQATPGLQVMLLTFFSMTFQGPVGWWVGKHRLHHKEVDTVHDPHSPKFGLLWSHLGWMCTKRGIQSPPNSFMRFGKRERGWVIWQARYYWWLAIGGGIVSPVLICGLLWGDWVGGLLVAVAARLLFQYHLTWVVNSLCHLGNGPEGSAKNIPLLGFLTAGESYHANHHKDDNDWRLGRRWWDIDPGKWFIWICLHAGWARPRLTRS